MTFKNLLVPTDFGDAATRALDVALDLAPSAESRITLLHVSWVPPLAYAGVESGGIHWPTDQVADAARRKLEAAFSLAKAKAGNSKIETLLASGTPWEEILRVAKARDCDLIVLGTHGRRGFSHALLGSIAEKVVRLSPTPVLAVPPVG
jgi:nucleotide-binding universal stress UspA family protein